MQEIFQISENEIRIKNEHIENNSEIDEDKEHKIHILNRTKYLE